ncbi:MAG TPA: ParB/RepB/Spo0J family partition protein [Candidatus Angelobacter sp.]|nr:ParB/RepB/Spo0J family partition protein [Candidatus Angelobacter sp.]
MNDKRKVLGRGLDSLLPGRSSAAMAMPAPNQESSTHEIRIVLIEPNPYQTRRRMDQEALKELAESIKVTGVIQPIVVRPLPEGRFQLVAGERRWLASKLADKSTIPAVVREISNEQAMEITIIENLQREDLNPVEQARAFERLSREFGLTQEQMSVRTGKDRPSIGNFMRLLKLPEHLQQLLETGELSFGHGKVLCTLTGFPDQLHKAAREVVTKNLSVRQTEDLVAKIINPEAVERQQPEPPPIDPNVREAARTLEQALGVKVEIQDHKGKGKIILKYASLDDFDRVVEALTHSQQK